MNTPAEKDPTDMSSLLAKLTTYLADHCAAELASGLDHGKDAADVAIEIMSNADNAVDDLGMQAKREAARADRLFQQIVKLGDHLMAEFPGEPRLSESAIDCAIRIMTELKGDNAAIRANAEADKPNWPRRYGIPTSDRQDIKPEQDEH